MPDPDPENIDHDVAAARGEPLPLTPILIFIVAALVATLLATSLAPALARLLLATPALPAPPAQATVSLSPLPLPASPHITEPHPPK